MQLIVGSSLQSLVDQALLVGSVGTVAMVLVEFIKAVARWRMRFHRYGIERWLSSISIGSEQRARTDRFKSFLKEEIAIWLGSSLLPKSGEQAKVELLALVAGGDRDAEAWYDQPADQLFAGLSRAAQLAVDFPGCYPSLYRFLVGTTNIDDEKKDSERWPALAPHLIAPGSTMAAHGCAGGGAQTGAREDAVGIRARLGNLVAARVAIFKNWSAWRSARSNQFLAFGVAIGLFLVVQEDPGVFSPRVVSLAVVAGMTAPFAKDLATRLVGARLGH